MASALLDGREGDAWVAHDMMPFTRRLLGLVVLAASCASGACGKQTDAATYLTRGNAYLDQGKLAEAVVEYRNAIKHDANLGEARYKLAETYLQSGDSRNALREAVRAADLLPGNVDAQLLAAKLLLLGGRFDDARTRAETVLTVEPRNVTAQILLGNALAGLKEFDQALAELQEAIDLDPTNDGAYTSLAALSAARGRQEEAEAAFKKATEVAPRSMSAHLALATYYWSIGDKAGAEQALAHALEIEPAHLGVNQALATLYVADNRPQEAEKYIQAVVDIARDAPSKLALSDFYIRFGRTAEALAVLEAVAEDPKAFAAAKARIALVEYSTGRRDAAHQTLAQVLAREGSNPTVLIVQGRLLLADGKLDEALKSALAAIKAEPQSASAHYLAGIIYTGRQDTAAAAAAFNEVLKLNPRAALAQVALARLELRDNRPDASADLARAALAQQPDSTAARLVLAQTLIAGGKLDEADAQLTELVDAFPQDAAVHASLGTLALARRDGAAAKQAFERALTLDPNRGQAFAGLVTVDLHGGRIAEARARVDARLKDRPRDSALWLLSAGVSLASRDYATGERALQRAIELDPSNLDAYMTLGQLYATQGRLEEARLQLERLAARQSKPIAAATMIASILELEGKRAEARQRYENVVALDPTAAVAANNLAWIYAEEEVNLDAALQLAQVAVARFPDRPDVIDTLGWVYFKMGLTAQALERFEQSYEKAPGTADFAYHLGLAHMKQGDWDKARPLLERTLELNPRFEGAVNAKQMLERIRS